MVYLGGMARRKLEERDMRTLFKLAGGKSFAVTIPIDIVRSWGWQNNQKLKLTIDEQHKKITVEEWKG